MSVDSSQVSPKQPSSFRQNVKYHLFEEKAAQSTVSSGPNIPRSRHSLRSPSKEQYQQEQQNSRPRTVSASQETSADKVPALLSIAPTLTNKYDNKHDRRFSEKFTLDKTDQTSNERRNSTPQLHFNTFIPHVFRNQKHHPKANIKDEPNSTNLPGTTGNTSSATSSLHNTDMMMMKGDPSFLLKLPVSSINGSQQPLLKSMDRSFSSQSADSLLSLKFILDEGTTELRSAESVALESHTPLSVAEIYREYFQELFHTNYHGEFENEGPFIASLRFISGKKDVTESCEARAIIRTSYRNCDVSETVNGINENNILQILLNKAHLPPVQSYATIGDPKANERIYLFDKTNDERFNCKIGVIHQRAKQLDEYEIFSNDHLSTPMCTFLEQISKRVSLKGYANYRGDLDTKDDLHGDHSYYIQYENHEIMFNVAPLIPSAKANGQCIERKGLVGNAFVCVVFQEPGAEFSPDFISGKVIQIYITVQPTTIDGELHYKIAIWRRHEITSIINPVGGTYKSDQSFAPMFLTLLLNAVNVAIESPNLRSRIYEQRQRLKHQELTKLIAVFLVGPMIDVGGDIDPLQSPIDTRPNTRSESMASNVTSTTNESASSNSGRISPVSSKKKGFSKKIFGVFTSRSGSFSSSSTPSNQGNNDGVPVSPKTPLLPDTTATLVRGIIPPSKDAALRARSIKPNQAPTLPPRPSNHQIPHFIGVQPPTPSNIPSNPFHPDSLTETNLLNTAALSIATRNRSNSSPEDTTNANKAQPLTASKIEEEEYSTETSSDDSDSDEESSDD